MNPEKHIAILNQLSEIESRFSVRVLYAIVSGSRAWGFESRDSDYDIRFIYVGQPSDYVTVFKKRDVIENRDILNPDPLLDFSGWDLAKFLDLASDSNPTSFEWMSSPIRYRRDPLWTNVKTTIWPRFSVKSAMLHYLSMAKHNYREHMRGDRVLLKKYLYIVRPLLCCYWLWVKQTPPPMPIAELMDFALGDPMYQSLRVALSQLIERKKSGDELDEGDAIPVINGFIEAGLTRMPELAETALDVPPRDEGEINDLFYRLVNECAFPFFASKTPPT